MKTISGSLSYLLTFLYRVVLTSIVAFLLSS